MKKYFPNWKSKMAKLLFLLRVRRKLHSLTQ